MSQRPQAWSIRSLELQSEEAAYIFVVKTSGFEKGLQVIVLTTCACLFGESFDFPSAETTFEVSSGKFRLYSVYIWTWYMRYSNRQRQRAANSLFCGLVMVMMTIMMNCIFYVLASLRFKLMALQHQDLLWLLKCLFDTSSWLYGSKIVEWSENEGGGAEKDQSGRRISTEQKKRRKQGRVLL